MRDYFAEIDAWKKKKDDEEYQAKVKAENEAWEAQEKLKAYWPQIKEICELAEKCDKNGLSLNGNNLFGNTVYAGLILKAFPTETYGRNDHHYYFGYKHKSVGFSETEFLMTEDGLVKTDNCQLFKKCKTQNVGASEVNCLLKQIPDFISRFYGTLDYYLKK